MNEISTLIWSECRRQRKTVLFLIFASLFFYSLITIFLQAGLFLSGVKVVVVALSIGLPVLYAVALGDSFASEFTNKSGSFLLGLPISKTKIYFVKYISSLMTFLPLSVVGCLLMYTCNNFYAKAPNKLILLMSLFLLSSWLLVHTAVFLCYLINRNSNNGIIMLLILPLLLLIIAPGIFSINMFFFVSDVHWLTTSIISTIIILYIIILMSGWYLWNKQISKDLKCFKPIMQILGMMFVVSFFLYFFADMYTRYQYNSALQEVQKIKLRHINRYNSQLQNTTTKTNAMYDIKKFSEYTKKHTTSKMYLYKMLARRPYLNIGAELWKKQDSKTEYTLNNINVQKIYSILEKVSNKQTIRYIPNFPYASFNMKVAIIFLTDLAITQARAGKNKAFFKSLKTAAKWCEFFKILKSTYDYDYLNARQLLRPIYYTMIKTGPEGTAYTDDYNTALKFIQNDKIYCPPYNLFSDFNHALGWANPKSSTNKLNSFFYRLRARQGLVSLARYKIKSNALYLEAQKSFDLEEIIEKNKKLIQESKKIVGYCKTMLKQKGLDRYFLKRGEMAGDKICLALKIFRCRYGKYPEKLKELCPDILKKIPLVPISGKTYKYKRKDNGFILSGGKTARRLHGYNFYKMEYQPWEEENK